MSTNVERLRELLVQEEVWRAIAEMHSLRLAIALDNAGVFLPPEGAEVSEGTIVAVPNDGSYPWIGGSMIWEEGRIYHEVGRLRTDITEAYHTWLAMQPKTTARTYEWTEPDE